MAHMHVERISIQAGLQLHAHSGFVSTRSFLPLALFRHTRPWWPTLCVSVHALSSAYKPSLPSLEYSNSTFKSNPVLPSLEQHTCAHSRHRVHCLCCVEPAEHCHCHIAILTLCTSVSPTTCNLTGAHLPGRAPGTSWKLVSVSRSTRRTNKGLCPELSSCSLLPLYKVNTSPRLFGSRLCQTTSLALKIGSRFASPTSVCGGRVC